MYQVSDADQKKIANNFTHHAVKPGQVERYDNVRKASGALAKTFSEICPASRELSLALTNLEQAMFWANAAIARNE